MPQHLLEGHHAFRKEYFEHERELFDALAAGRHEPTAMVISCSDARVVPNIILKAQPGDLFVVRNIANLVPPYEDVRYRSVGAALEYAVHVLRVPHIVVCGHTQCGGLRALINGHEKLVDDMPSLAAWLHDAAAVRGRLARLHTECTGERLEKELINENVVVQLEHLLTYPVVARALNERRLEIHGWVYDLTEARVRVYRPDQNLFEPFGA
jgi:carbonic anhydrase